MALFEPTEALRPGDTLGRYQLLVPVGAGGMGKVWAARSLGTRPMQRLVAIKTALAEAMANPEFERLFLDEARIASLIQHPNVCGLHGLDEEDGVTYLVMDWSDGGTLRELLDALPERRLPCDLAAVVAAHVCAGLHAAHELVGEDGAPMHVVHRDVSPQNILFAATGHVKITDFGVAKARGQLHRPTETGEMKGKISYMAPEQVTTKEVDRRVDIFALGCVLYEATVGSLPFHGDDALSTLYQLLEQDLPRPSTRVDGYPPGLEAIVMRALEKDPDDRFQTAAALEQALLEWVRSAGKLATEREVGSLLRHALGTRMGERESAITTAISRLDSNQPATDSERAPTRGVTTAEPTMAEVDEATGATGVRRLPWVTSAGIAAAVAAVVAIVAVRATSPAAAPATSAAATAGSARVASSSPPASAAAEPASVVITARAEPADAVLRIDDGPALPNPYVMTVPVDGDTHELMAAAPGHEPRTEFVVFDRNQQLVLVLPPIERGELDATRAPVAARPRATGGRPSRLEPPSSATHAARSKPPRQLDHNNPFEAAP